MNFFDMKTIIFSYMISNAICATVIAFLWIQNRKRYNGIHLWFADFVMQFTALVLIVLRNIIPDFLSMVGSNSIVVLGTILLYMGLQSFLRIYTKQKHNFIILIIFILIHTYATVAKPSLLIRNINISICLFILCSQLAWFMLYKVNNELRPITRGLGFIFSIFCLISITKLFVDLAIPSGNDFFKSNIFDSLLILSYQIIYIILTFGLSLMVNRRLILDLEEERTVSRYIQEALQHSQEKFSKAFHSSPDAILITRASDGVIIEVNEGFSYLTEYSREEALSNSTIVLGLWANQHDRKKFITELIEHNRLRDQEFDFITKSGKRIHGLISCEIIYLGNERHLLSIVRDITERKLTEKLIQTRLKILEYSTKNSLEELMQKALDEIELLTDSRIGFYHFVEADQKTLSLQVWSTRTLNEFCKAEGKGMHYSIDKAGVWVDCIYQRKPVIHNNYASLPNKKGLPDGHVVIIRELVVPVIFEGRIVSILGVGNKPTDYDEKDVRIVSYIAEVIWSVVKHKISEKQLMEYQHRLEIQNLELRKLMLAIEQGGNTIVITNANGDIEYVNPRFEQTTGYTIQEAIGKNPRILKSGEQPAEYYRVLWETIKSGQIWRGEFHNKRKDNSLYWEHATIAPVQNEAGEITNFIAIKEDITERKQSLEMQRQYIEQLAVQNAELDAFSYTVAHDLKNPIGMIISYADLMINKAELIPQKEFNKYLEIMLRSAKKSNEIIEELLLLAGVRKEKIVAEPLDSIEIIRESIERLSIIINQKQAEIIILDGAKWPIAIGHAPWIEEVWFNYINNAIKYGGRPPIIEIGAKAEPDGKVRFWVRDNGPGLSIEAKNKLFAPFTRLTQVRVEGHGLGLSVVRRIVEKLGGTVGVESNLGQGSLFYFTLPSATSQNH